MLSVDERGCRLAFLERRDLADEERVIAGVVVCPYPALEPCQRVREQERTRLTGPCLDPGPKADRGNPACEVGRDRRLVAAQDRDAEQAGSAEQFLKRDILADRDAHERRIQR